MNDPAKPDAASPEAGTSADRNPEGAGSGSRSSAPAGGDAPARTGSGSRTEAFVLGPRRDAPSDVVLYEEPLPGKFAGAKSGSSTAPTAARTTGSGAAATSPSGANARGSAATGSNPAAAMASGSSSRSGTPVPIAWRVWPVIDSVWELLGLSTVLVLVPLVTWSLSGRTALTVLCTFAVGAVTWRHFFPTICEVNALGVTQRLFGRTKRIPWLSIDRYVVGRKGVFLTSAGAPLELFRGLYLPWGAHREQILASLRYYLPHAEDAA